jgi:hypothetical protein
MIPAAAPRPRPLPFVSFVWGDNNRAFWSFLLNESDDVCHQNSVRIVSYDVYRTMPSSKNP